MTEASRRHGHVGRGAADRLREGAHVAHRADLLGVQVDRDAANREQLGDRKLSHDDLLRGVECHARSVGMECAKG